MSNIKFTATQQSFIDSMQGTSIIDIQESIGKVKSCDIILSMNRPSKIKLFFNSVVSFFKRLFGIKDDKHIFYVTKNRKKSGNINCTVDFKKQTITKNN
jgi:hypothetical protein